MRTFDQLRALEPLVHADDSALGPIYWRATGGVLGSNIHVFDSPELLAAYVATHARAASWLRREPRLRELLAADEPLEVGRDFAIMPRRAGSSLANLDDPDDRPPDLERLVELRSVIAHAAAAATDPLDQLVASMIAARVMRADHHTIYMMSDDKFYIQDLAPSPDELRAWQAAITPRS